MVAKPGEFSGRGGLIQQEEDGHDLTASEEHTLMHRHGEDTPEARRRGVNRLHRQGLDVREEA